MTTVGTGHYTYEVIDTWGNVSSARISCVGVDSQDRVYLGIEKDPPIMVLDREGNYISGWGTGVVVGAHSIYIGPDDVMYLTDDHEHVALKFTLDGRPLLVLGTRGQPSDTGVTRLGDAVLQAAGPFNLPTKMVLSPSGDIYVSDGDGNSRVHRFSADGRLITSWGSPGKQAPGEFDRPHGMWVDSQERVYVCDRKNNRIQIFSADGEFIDQWMDVSNPADICIDANDTVYVSECVPHKGVSIRDRQGKVLAWLELPPTPSNPHRLCVDSRGDIYVTQGDDHKINKYVKIR